MYYKKKTRKIKDTEISIIKEPHFNNLSNQINTFKFDQISLRLNSKGLSPVKNY